jgi:predicted DNA-binding transcriptional regulator YafY
MEATICSAISDQLVVSFDYKGKRRRVEPHTLGVHGNGSVTLCGWQLSGGSGESWRDFLIEEMSALRIENEAFTGPRAGYRRGDQTLQRVICQL